MLYVFDEAGMLRRFTVTESEPKELGGKGGGSSGVCTQHSSSLCVFRSECRNGKDKESNVCGARHTILSSKSLKGT